MQGFFFFFLRATCFVNKALFFFQWNPEKMYSIIRLSQDLQKYVVGQVLSPHCCWWKKAKQQNKKQHKALILQSFKLSSWYLTSVCVGAELSGNTHGSHSLQGWGCGCSEVLPPHAASDAFTGDRALLIHGCSQKSPQNEIKRWSLFWCKKKSWN